MGRIIWNYSLKFFYGLVNGRIDDKLYRDILDSIGCTSGTTIDEFGCGNGGLTRRFPETTHVRAVDFSEEAIKFARKVTKPNVSFYNMDFYKDLPNGYKPDILVACRCLYHPSLEFSLERLAEHVGEGVVVIAHPNPDFKKYIIPEMNGARNLNLKQILKRTAGNLSGFFGHDYHLFREGEFRRIGEQFFHLVSVEDCAYGTHLLIKLEQRR